MLAWAFVACTAPVEPKEPVSTDPEPTDTEPPDTDPPPIDTATPPTDTGTLPTINVCDALPTGPFTWISSALVHTEEDFDFDNTGLLAMQSFTDLVGIDHTGQIQLIAPSVGVDIAGVRSLPTGDFIVAQQDTATVRRVNASTGNTVNVVTGLNFPNGLEVGLDGMAYVSEYAFNGRVRMFDPYTGQNQVILEIPLPNGLALSPDEQTLYVVTSSNLFGGDGHIIAIDRDPTTGEWGTETRLVYEANQLLDAITVDTCGNVYAAEYNSGKVVRVRLDGTSEQLVDLPNARWEGYCAARFGNGIGDWERTKLYVSNRDELYAIDIGVEGRHVLAAP